jgi:GNAT superfamily N-acetyltransferase
VPATAVASRTARAKAVEVKPARGTQKLKKIRLAEGTVARPRKPSAPAGGAVQAVEVRPSGTVISRRPLAKRPAILHLPHQPATAFTAPAWMLAECKVAPARAGDQSEILQLLAGLPCPPTRAEFHAAVDHPDHDAGNRLVARLAGRIVGHVEIVPRELLLGTARVTGAMIDRLAVLPECRGAGHGRQLVRAAEERMRQSGAVVALSRTRIAAAARGAAARRRDGDHAAVAARRAAGDPADLPAERHAIRRPGRSQRELLPLAREPVRFRLHPRGPRRPGSL